MAVMKKLTIGGVTYDTVGEASVSQVVSTGTKIATVTIDGTATDLYAPSGGSSVDPATATPIMDGTAAVGSSTKYAREDHVHPSDTSKLSLSGGTITGNVDFSIPSDGDSIRLGHSACYIDYANRNDDEYIDMYAKTVTITNASVTLKQAPTANMQAATKKYVDDNIPTNVSELINDSGYLTLATLPIYDGSVS